METFRVLLAEDDPVVRRLEVETLERWGYTVAAAEGGADLLKVFSDFDPHLVILDVDLPAFDGFEWCARIRAVSKVPILFLTALDSPRDEIRALAGGADAWLPKPLDTELLAARVRSLLRRAYAWAAERSRILVRGELAYDVERRTASRGAVSAALTENEGRILESLLAAEGRPVSRMDLMDALWSADAFVDDNTLTVNVSRLKRRLDEIGLADLVETRKGEGYRIP